MESAARSVFTTRAMRAFADGLMSTSLATLLLSKGLSKSAVGVVSTATLLGSATSLLVITRFAAKLKPLRVLIGMSVLMAVTGAVFAWSGALAVLVLVAIVGPLNPSSGDVSPFLPAEQTVLGSAVEGPARTRAFAQLTLVASASAAAGAFLSGPIARIGARTDLRHGVELNAIAYALVGLLVIPIYLASAKRVHSAAVSAPQRLVKSRKVIRELTAVFVLDAAGGGMVLYSIFALWLKVRFGYDLSRIGTVLGFMSLAAAASALLAPKLSMRFGLVETMAVTHAIANGILIIAVFAPNAPIAVACLIARSLLSQLDVGPRTAFIMSLVPPEERSAATAFTNLPRSLATATTPFLAAKFLEHSAFGWPILIGALMKLAYDALLWVRFRGRSIRA